MTKTKVVASKIKKTTVAPTVVELLRQVAELRAEQKQVRDLLKHTTELLDALIGSKNAHD